MTAGVFRRAAWGAVGVVALWVITVAVSYVASVAGPVPEPTPTTTLRPFECYEVHDKPRVLREVVLADLFGTSSVRVLTGKRICAPADLNDDGSDAAGDPQHLLAYRIKQTTPRFAPIRDQVVVNRFGTSVVDLIRPYRLLVPTAKSLTTAPLPLAPGLDHFKCYRVRRGRLRASGITVRDQFGTTIVDIKRPVHLCTAVDKNGEGVHDPTAHLMCYQLRLSARSALPRLPNSAFTLDQFGGDEVGVFGPRELCVLSRLNPGAPTATPETTPTLTPVASATRATTGTPTNSPTPTESPSLTPVATQTHTPTTTATTGETPTTTQTPTATATPTPTATAHAPVIVSSPLTSAGTRYLYRYPVEAIDPDAGEILTFALEESPEGMLIEPTTGVIEWTPSDEQQGEYPVVVVVRDRIGLSDSQSFAVAAAAAPNRAPVITTDPPTMHIVQPECAELVSILGEVDFEDGTLVGSNASWLAAQANEPLPFRNLHVTPGPIEFAHVGIGSTSGRPGLLTLSLWDLDSAFSGNQVTSLLLDGAPQPISQFEVDEADSSVKLFQIPVDASLLTDGQVTVSLGIGDPPLNNEVGIDFSRLQVQCPRPAVDSEISAAFNSGNEGWDVVDLANPPRTHPPIILSELSATFSSVGGNSGGHISAVDPSSQAFFFRAPTLFLGDKSTSIGGLLKYDMMLSGAGEAGGPAVLFVGRDRTLAARGDPAGTAWETFSIRLVAESFAINATDGPPATDQDVAAVLSDLQALYILGDWVTGVETARLDNVTLSAGLTVYEYDADAIDPDSDPLTFSLPVAPSGMTVDPVAGELRWSPTAADVGDHEIVIRVEDGRGGSDEQRYTVTVIGPRAAPPVAVDDDYSVRVNETLHLDAPGVLANDTDANGDALTSMLVRGPTNGDLQLNADGSFDYTPNTPPIATGGLDPVLEWAWTGSGVESDFKQVMMTPIVVNLTDDNQDGRVDADDIPDVIFAATNRTDGQACFSDGILRVVSGADGSPLFDVVDRGLRVNPCGSPAVGDLDGDGLPEIVAFQQATSRLLILNHDGTLKHVSDVIPGLGGPPVAVQPSIADLDHDGVPELIIGATVLTSEGHTIFHHADTGNDGYGGISTTADLDLDGTEEVVTGFRAYRADGTLFYDAGTAGGYPAIGNFDDDANPEIVVVRVGQVYLLNHDGTIEWGPKAIPGGGRGGPPTVADVDGDGQPEIGVAGASRYAVFETNGDLKWQATIQDGSSNFTGSSVFDFEGDGQAEVAYGDEVKLRIFRGSTGEVLFETLNPSCTAVENPTIVDVDNDGHAEIVLSRNNICGFGLGVTNPGIAVYGGRANNWVRTRRIWNQHAYHITNVREDASIPAVELPNWLLPGLNNFRLNAFAPEDTAAADSFTYKANDAALDSNEATVVITVRPPQSPPHFTSQPITTAAATAAYVYAAQASDPDAGDVLTFSLPLAPAGMVIASATGLIQWIPTVAQIGSHAVTVRVEDSTTGLFALQPYTVTVGAAPVATATPLATPTPSPSATPGPVSLVLNPRDRVILVGETQAFDARGSFADGTTSDVTGDVVWSSSDAGVASVSASGLASGVAEGVATITASLNGLSDSTPLIVAAVVQGDATLPTVAITAPAIDAVLRVPTVVIGTAEDANLLRYELALAEENAQVFSTLATGTSPVVNGTVGTLDPTLLPNGVYRVRLTAFDRGGNSNTAETRVSVAGDLKLGNFRVTFTDLTIPVAGIPISITRTYDSLDTSPGDFGAGWRIGYPGQVTDSARETPSEAFTDRTRVYVTKPDGRRVGFSFVAQCGFFGCAPSFRADPGVFDTLASESMALFRSGGSYYSFSGTYNPRTYVLTTKEKVKYTLDELSGLQRIEDASGNTLSFTPGGIVSSTGVAVTFERDAAGRITKVIEPVDPGATDPRAFLAYEYDASGNLVRFFDQLTHATKYSYADARFPHYLTKIEDPLGRPITRSVFNDAGQLIGLCDGNGNPATLAGCTRLTPNPDAQLQTIVNAKGFQTDLLLDARGNVLTERRFTGDPAVPILDTVRSYDASDNLLRETDPEGNVKSYTYDARGNQLTRTEGGRTTRFTYNTTCNKVETVRNPANVVETTNDYDATGCTLRFVTNALGHQTEYQYNDARHPTQVTDFFDANRVHWHWSYDGAGFLESMTDSLAKTATYRFSRAGDLLSQIDRKNQQITFTYDDAHRLETETWDTTPPRVTTYGYNDAGQLTGAVDPDSSLTLGYESATGRLASVDNTGTPGAPAVEVTYGYDGNGNVTEVGDSLGGVTTYEYDALDRLDRITQSGSGVNEKVIRLDYYRSGLLEKLRRFSDLNETQPVANTTYGYDCGGCAGRVTSIHHRKASDGSVIHDFDFPRDDVGNITSMTDAEGIHIYTYDLTRQLKTATHPVAGAQPNESYDYDPVGNRTTSHLSSSYTYRPNSNRLAQDDHFTYEVFDDNGNLEVRLDRTTGEGTTFTYDHRNRLLAVVRRASNGTELARSAYHYDAANRRIRTEESSVTTHFLYDGLNPTLKVADAGGLTNRRLYSRMVDGVMADEVAGETRWVLADQVGTVRDLIADDTTAVTRYTYDSFGRDIAQTSPEVENDLRFTGREFRDAAQDGYFRARNYNPHIGRFVQEDPIGPHGYTYANNNPLVFRDPTGRTSTLEYISLYGNAKLVVALIGAASRNASPGEFVDILTPTCVLAEKVGAPGVVRGLACAFDVVSVVLAYRSDVRLLTH